MEKKVFKLIQGSSTNLAEFESQISQALADGYEFSNDLITQVVNLADKVEVKFFQAMILDDEETYELEEDEFFEEEEEFADN